MLNTYDGPGEFGDAKERAKKRLQKWMDAERNAMTQSPMQEFQRHHRESDHVPQAHRIIFKLLKTFTTVHPSFPQPNV